MDHGVADDLGFLAFEGLKQFAERLLLLVGELDAFSDSELQPDLACSRRLDDPLVSLLFRHPFTSAPSLASKTIHATPRYTRPPLGRALDASIRTAVRAARL